MHAISTRCSSIITSPRGGATLSGARNTFGLKFAGYLYVTDRRPGAEMLYGVKAIINGEHYPGLAKKRIRAAG